MKLDHQSHQLHFFSNNADIEASSLFISAMTHSLSEQLSVVPNTGREFEPIQGIQRDFLILTTPDGGVRIEFPSNEIVISKEGGSLDEFQELCVKILNSICFKKFVTIDTIKYINCPQTTVISITGY